MTCHRMKEEIPHVKEMLTSTSGARVCLFQSPGWLPEVYWFSRADIGTMNEKKRLSDAYN